MKNSTYGPWPFVGTPAWMTALSRTEAELMKQLGEAKGWERIRLSVELSNVAFLLGQYPPCVGDVLPDVEAFVG